MELHLASIPPMEWQFSSGIGGMGGGLLQVGGWTKLLPWRGYHKIRKIH